MVHLVNRLVKHISSEENENEMRIIEQADVDLTEADMKQEEVRIV